MAQNTTSGPMQKYKIVFLGDQAVGKTSIINRFIFDNFTGNEQPTVGIDFISKTLQVDTLHSFKQIFVQQLSITNLLDFSYGIQLDKKDLDHSYLVILEIHKQPSFVLILQVMIILDNKDDKSFQNLPRWIEDVKEERGDEVLIYILGNKIDLENERQVSTKQAEDKAKELGAQFQEVSAKSAINVAEFFKKLSYDLLGNPAEQVQNQQQQKPQQAPQIQIKNYPNNNDNEEKKQVGGGCC